jgi:predicted permease
MFQDVRFGFRLLARNPTFALAAVTVMALGVGATTAVFTVVRGVLLQPLPYREPNRLVLFRADLPGYLRQPLLASDELFALRDRSDLFEAVAVVNESEGNLTTPDDMEAATAASVGDNFFQTLGVRPALGRTVTHQDIGTGWVNAVDISDEVWRKHFHADPEIIGRTIDVNNLPMAVVGVMPPGFRLYLGPGVNVASRVDIYFPRVKGYDDDPARSQVVIARLKPGVTLAGAQSAVDAMTPRLAADHPSRYRAGAVRISLSTLDQDVVSEVKPALVALGGAVAFVLLVACANLTNLLLARASARAREIAVRTSIGASRRQIVRQLVVEGLVVGALGAAGGLLLAQWGVESLVLLAPPTLPRLESIGVDGSVAAFTIAVSLFSALVVSVVPAWHSTRPDLAATLKHNAVSSTRAGTTRGLLIAGQLALSLVLLVGAGLMARAFINMRHVQLGFDPHGALTMNVHLQGRRFNTGSLAEARERRLAFYHQLADSARQIPGVERIGIGLPVPLGGPPLTQRVSLGPEEAEHATDGGIALSGFLETLRVPLVAGRYFAVADDNARVLIVDERLARELWPGESAIGKRLLITLTLSQHWTEVIGVVSHVQMRGLRAGDLPQIWMTYASRSYSDLNIVARGPNPAALAVPVEQAVQRLGPGRPVHDIHLMDEYLADASADTRFALFVIGAFAFVAVVLTGLGLYGVVAYVTARRTREIAVRLALGAEPTRIVRLVLRDGVSWTIGGLAGGLAGALAVTRYLESLLFRVRANDAVTFVGVAVVLVGVALVATALPALRAVRVDPMRALRSE